MAKSQNVEMILASKAELAGVALAVKAIESFAAGQAELLDLQNKAEKKHGELSGHVWKVCCEAVKLAGNDLPKAVSYARALFKKAEETYKAAHPDNEGKQVSIEKLLPSWGPTKSVMISYMEKKHINPADFKTATDFRKKGAERAPKGADSQDGSTPVNATDFMTDGMGVVFAHLEKAIRNASEETQNRYAAKVSALATEIERAQAQSGSLPIKVKGTDAGEERVAANG